MLVISAVGKLRHRTARDIGDEQLEMLVVVAPTGKTARGTIPVTPEHDLIVFELRLGRQRRCHEGNARPVPPPPAEFALSLPRFSGILYRVPSTLLPPGLSLNTVL